jgi:predicted DNA-binding transcriptional regulator YafY
MSSVTLSDEYGDEFDRSKFNIGEYAKRVFGMFDGEVVRAKLSFKNHLVNVVLDHFGKDVRMMSAGEGWFDIWVDISISPVFLAWMFNYGDNAIIKEPDSLIIAMRELIEINRQQYL